MKALFLLCTIALLSLSGCAGRTDVGLAPFDEATYAPYDEPGTATITGTAFLVTNGGDIKIGAARQIFLIPDTKFLRDRIDETDKWYPTYDWLIWHGTDTDTIARAWGYNKIAVADIGGKFIFEHVPAGRYLVETQLFWSYRSCGIRGCADTEAGSVLRRHVDVGKGETVDVQLTDVINR